MMNFINPHAILLCKENAGAINRTTGLNFDVIKDLLEDISSETVPHFVVGWRDINSGLPMCDVLALAELKEKYQLDELPPYINEGFRKL